MGFLSLPFRRFQTPSPAGLCVFQLRVRLRLTSLRMSHYNHGIHTWFHFHSVLQPCAILPLQRESLTEWSLHPSLQALVQNQSMSWMYSLTSWFRSHSRWASAPGLRYGCSSIPSSGILTVATYHPKPSSPVTRLLHSKSG